MGFGRRLRRAVRRVARAVSRVGRNVWDTIEDGSQTVLRGARDLALDPLINPNQEAMKAQANALKEQNELAQKEYEEAQQQKNEQANALREQEKGKYDNVGSALGSLLEEEDQMLGAIGKKKKSAL